MKWVNNADISIICTSRSMSCAIINIQCEYVDVYSNMQKI